MARLPSTLLLAIIQYAVLDCTKRTLMLIQTPYCPRTCKQLCSDLPDYLVPLTYKIQEDLSGHRASANNSTDLKDSLKTCLIEDRRTNQTLTFTLKSGQDICKDLYEEVYQPDLLHSTVEDTRAGDHSVRHASPNVSLHQAGEEGQLKTVQFILSQRPDGINARDKHGRTPVMAAVMKNQGTVFDFLVSKSCDLLAVDNNKDTVLHLACAVGNVDTVRKLVNHTCNIESRGRAGMTPVMVAVRCGHLSVVKYLVSEGCNLTIVDNTENNILHIACMCGPLDMVKYIISQQKVSVDSKGQLGRTAVMVSANIGRFDIFSYLVNNKCNFGIVDNFRNDILHFACVGGNLDIVKHVFSDQRKDGRGYYLGQTPVMTAVDNSHLSVVIYLTGKGCKLTVPNTAGDTILHVACVRGHLDMVKYIFSQQKISINSKGQYRRTPVMAAAYSGYLDVVKYLVEKGCGLAEVDDKGNNVLALACKFPRKDVVNYRIGISSLSKNLLK